jgi:glycosyltransferase involved in cell wall biosynthesis
MRVLVVSHVSGLGGAERSLLDLTEALRGTPGLVLVAAVPGEGPLGAALRAAGVEVISCSALRRLARPLTVAMVFALWRGARQLRRIVGDRRIDVVHANSASAALFAWRLGRPLVWHVRDLRPGPEIAWLGRAAAAVIAPSRACADLVRSRAPGANIEVIPNGVDVDRLVRAAPARAEADAPRVLAVGHLVSWKRYDLMLEAAGHLARAGVGFHLTVVGGDPFNDEEAALTTWRARAHQLGLAGAVEFVGSVADVSPWLARSDLLLHCAFPEPFGRAVIEAMAAGLPVVAMGGHHGPAEILADGLGGWLVGVPDAEAVAAALAAALGDRAEMRRRGRQGQAKARALYRAADASAAVARAYRRLAAPFAAVGS